MPDTSVSFGTVEVFEALPPHPMASWEPGNVHLPLRISACLDEAGILLIHIDTAVTLDLADDAPPFEIYVDGGHVYGDLTEVERSDCAHPDHGHPVPWRVAAGGSTPSRDEHTQPAASRDRQQPAAANATERPDVPGTL
ncbi:hypothetical protein UG55_111119 [Frankia sp. EI5c]|uniref:hypothetical protein n=1 Tax=Frankia sp. EI5c TaxID=683316 RepID=UPI0007C39BFE|nr:hypothetical protein [Frankia sp. EI5c]OAA18451.1 hypothetical protein UG55_111119 [Frankia sp. EI5c]